MQSRPNILLIMCDQLSAKALVPGFADAPNIDGIIKRGVSFTQANTVCPLCMPARASIWTGRYPHETGVADNIEEDHREFTLPMPTLGEVFSEAGYRTVHFGKMHDGGALRGFKLVSPPVKKPFECDLPVNYDSFEDVDTTEKAIVFLKHEMADAAPFLMVADLNNPHNICQFTGENESWPMPDESLLPPLPSNFHCPDFVSRPLPLQYNCCNSPRQAQAAHWTELHYRHYLYAYKRYLNMVDTQIGQILNALEKSGKAGNTVIVFTADHGDALTAFGMVTKHISMYDNIVNIPFAVYDPRSGALRGVNRERLVSNLDIFPTLCEIAQITPPENLRGYSVLSGTGPRYVVAEWLSEYDSESPVRMIRIQGFKYIHYTEGDSEELFDMDNDPGECRNLSTHREYQGKLAECRDILREHAKKCNDPYFSLKANTPAHKRAHRSGFKHHGE